MTRSYLSEEVVHEGLVLHGDLHLIAACIALLLKHENTKQTEVSSSIPKESSIDLKIFKKKFSVHDIVYIVRQMKQKILRKTVFSRAKQKTKVVTDKKKKLTNHLVFFKRKEKVFE